MENCNEDPNIDVTGDVFGNKVSVAPLIKITGSSFNEDEYVQIHSARYVDEPKKEEGELSSVNGDNCNEIIKMYETDNEAISDKERVSIGMDIFQRKKDDDDDDDGDSRSNERSRILHDQTGDSTDTHVENSNQPYSMTNAPLCSKHNAEFNQVSSDGIICRGNQNLLCEIKKNVALEEEFENRLRAKILEQESSITSDDIILYLKEKIDGSPQYRDNSLTQSSKVELEIQKWIIDVVKDMKEEILSYNFEKTTAIQEQSWLFTHLLSIIKQKEDTDLIELGLVEMDELSKSLKYELNKWISKLFLLSDYHAIDRKHPQFEGQENDNFDLGYPDHNLELTSSSFVNNPNLMYKSSNLAMTTNENFQTQINLMSVLSDKYYKSKSLELDSYKNTVTVKFIMAGDVPLFTNAYKLCSSVRELKDNITAVFRIPVRNMHLSRKGVKLTDDLMLSELGVEPNEIVEINFEATDFKVMDSKYFYSGYTVPDVITVRIAQDGGSVWGGEDHVKEIVVEIENMHIRKPFLGGYRDKKSGVEYHHASSQTLSLLGVKHPELKMHRDAQTAEQITKTVNTSSERETQVPPLGALGIPEVGDIVLQPCNYVDSTEIKRRNDLNKINMAISIQRYVRGWLARRKLGALKEKRRKQLGWEMQTGGQDAEEERINNAHLLGSSYPQSKADFEILYALVERWHRSELAHIKAIPGHESARRALFCSLLEKEIKLLASIERHRCSIKEKTHHTRQIKMLEKMTESISWVGYKGLRVSLETVSIQRAREFKELYHAICREDVSLEERIELLVTLKYALKRYTSNTVDEITRLLNRECEFLVRGLRFHHIDILHKRIISLLLEFMKDLQSNANVATRCFESDNVIFCKRCHTLKPFTEFLLHNCMNTVKSCGQCFYLDNIASPRIDFSPFKHIAMILQREEQKQASYSSVAFIMQDYDFYYLIVHIWHSQSAISEQTNIKYLRLGRWNINIPWSPWNCILLTEKEIAIHSRVTHLEEIYELEFRTKVKQKHQLAKMHFSQLTSSEQLLLN